MSTMRFVNVHAGGRRRHIMSGRIIIIIVMARTIITGVIPFALPEERSKPFIRNKVLSLPTKEEVISSKLNRDRNTQTSITLQFIHLIQIFWFHHGHQNTHNAKTPERDQIHIQCRANE
jgi:hypothetical protein